MKSKAAFTLVELLVGVTIIATLFALALPTYRKVMIAAAGPIAANTLNQLRLAGEMYQSDNNGSFWKYRQNVPGGVTWWYGFETAASMAKPEGQRSYEINGGALGRYIGGASKGIKTDPAYSMYGRTFKPKYSNGLGYIGYGYNVMLSRSGTQTAMMGWTGNGTPVTRESVKNSSQTVVFVSSAQVNTFQAPASSKNPMIEEFVGVDSTQVVHYRFGDRAIAVFADGRVGYISLDGATVDSRMPPARIAALPAKYLNP